MNILALDTSSRACSCALLREGRLAGEFYIHTAHTHSQTLLPMVEDLLRRTGTEMDAIDGFAVSTGPGSFTGLRIGIAAIKGMAMAVDKPCAAVSTLEALAYNLVAFEGMVIPMLDARRSQVYTAVFRAANGGLEQLEEDEAVPAERVRERIAALPGEPVLLLGDGAALGADWTETLPQVRLAPEALRHQRASSVALVAAGLPAEQWMPPGQLAPSYLRLPQAERERLAKLER